MTLHVPASEPVSVVVIGDVMLGRYPSVSVVRCMDLLRRDGRRGRNDPRIWRR